MSSMRRKFAYPPLGAALDLRVRTSWAGTPSNSNRGLRGDLPPAGPLVSQSQSFLTRAYDLKKKERSVLNQFNDDSLVYSESRSSQQQKSGGMRPNKKRGDSFNVGRHTESGLSRKENRHHPKAKATPLDPSSWPQPINSKCSLPTDSRAYHDRNTGADVSKSTSSSSSLLSQMNRRRSEGHGLSSHRALQQQEAPLQQQRNLLSMKSSPNLVQTDGEPDRGRDGHLVEQSPMTGTKSTPSIPGDLNKQQSGWSDSKVMLDNNSAYVGGNSGILSYTSNMYTTEMDSSSQKNARRSMPFYNLHRYMPDYENVNHLGSAPLRSEKISEIDDIDEVTGKDSLPNSPSPKALSPNPHPHSDGLPTRDPNTLKYIKVNQNHEKYPSWPVTKPNGASEQSQPINSRAVSMTDHTNTSKEFPKKQVLAYTPGLNPLTERNSPTSERKGEDGRFRNTSDPGFKSEFVYDRFGRVQRRNYNNVEQKFDDFYNNSKPGYPPPNMDPDGHNIGDKDYNAPSPPERENKGVNENELSKRLDKVQAMPTDSKNAIRHPTSPEYQRTFESDQVSNSDHKSRPTQLNLNPSHSSTRTDSGTSPLEKNFPKAKTTPGMLSPRQWNTDHSDSPMSSGRDQKSTKKNHMQSYNPMYPGFQNESFAHPGDGGVIHSGRAKSYKEQSSSIRPPSGPESRSHIDRSRPASYTSHSGASPGSSENNKAFIVKQTPYYNTSTQTEMMPYAVKLSSPLANQPGSKMRNADIQVGNFGTQTSPQSPQDMKGKFFEEKSIQARMSRDFQGSELDSSLDKVSMDSKRNVSGGDFFRYPTPSSSLVSQPSQFLSREGIQAKYSTDEHPTDSPVSTTLSGIPHFSENTAPILRKLSEEFYGGRLNQLQQDKRSMSSTSSQEMSPRHDSSSLSNALHQPGMREAESYSSVVIHHDVSSTLFGRDDYAGSMSSMGDSRNDASFSDTSSNYKALDVGAPRARNSLDPALSTQKGRFLMQQQDSTRLGVSTGSKHSRELSAPVSSSAYTNWLPRSPQLSSSADYLATDSAISSGSDVSSLASQTRSSSAVQTSMSPIGDKSVETEVGSSIQTRPLSGSDHSSNKRLSSDSVFEPADDRETEESQSYQFNRKPSLRKAYGIYDETERLISQGKSLSKALEQTNTDGDPNSVYAVVSRGMRYSESLGLGQIKEEGDPSVNEDDTKISTSKSLLEGRVVGRREEKQQKYQYAWQNESWRKSRPEFDFSRGSNLKRTTSEQIAFPKGPVGLTPSSYDAEMSSLSTHLQASESTGLLHMPRSQSESSSLKSPNDAELKKVQQQAVLSFYQRKASAPGGGGQGRTPLSSTSSKDSPSPESSMYESVGNQSRSTTESVSDIISKANENLAKSAQRVDSIRRSNSASSRHSSDYMEMARHDRMRKETEWSKLRTSGSIRYSPEHHSGIRSNRSSYASENHYEDIGIFASSTPTEEKKDMENDERGQPDANMDTGVMASPTYLNVPVKRRPPPPPPRSPSPDAPPPALPPRNYKENIHTHNATNNNNNSNISNYNKANVAPLSHQPISGNRGQTLSPSTQNIVDTAQRARTLPMARTQPLLPEEEESSVDNSTRNFKSLMSQWENSSPREERYAAELRRQAQLRLTTQKQSLPNNSQPLQQQQQQQHPQHPPHPNAMPMSVKHSRPSISLATTYKREPTLPQEATSPPMASSSMPSSTSAIMPPSSSNFASAHYLSSVSSSVLSAQPSSLSSTSSSMPINPSSSAPVISSALQSSAFNKQHPTGACGQSPYHDTTHQASTHSTAATSNMGHHAFLNSSSSITKLPPHIPQRVGLLEESRIRSNSDASLAPSQSTHGSGSSRPDPHTQPYRDRSSSDNDILDDRKGVASSSLLHFSTSRSSPAPSSTSSSSSSTNNAPSSTMPISPKEKTPATTKWRPKRGPMPPPPPLQPNLPEDAEIGDVEFPPPPLEALQIVEQNDEGFSDESYIGHKSKTSRPIGTYKRSKSAAVLQTDNNNYKIAGDSDNSTFPEKKLGQQSWNSESVLQPHPANSQGASPSSVLPGNRIGSIPEHLPVNNTDSPPARPPARVSRASRQYHSPTLVPPHESSSSSLPTNSPSSISTSSSPSTHNLSTHTSPSRSSSTTTAGAAPVFTARPFVIEQPGWVAHRDSPRRQPPPVPNSPPFDPDAPQFTDASPQAHSALPATSQSLDHQKRQQVWSCSSSDAVAFSSNRDGASSQYSQHSPHRQPTSDRSSAVESSWGSPYSTVASPLPSSSSQAINSNNSFQNHQRNNSDDALPMTPPPRDYNRRDSAPARPAPDAKTTPSSSDMFTSVAHRRQSESSVTTPRSENDNSDLSTHSSSSHTRQPSQEELECDLKAKQLAQELEHKEQKLSEVLRQDASKKRMQYMDGLFSDPFPTVDGVNSTDNKFTLNLDIDEPDKSKSTGDLTSSNSSKNNLTNDNGRRQNLPKEYWMSAPKALVEMQIRQNQEMVKDLTRDIKDSSSLMKQKEELLESLSKKLDVLEEDKISVQKEIEQNDNMGVQIFDLIKSKCSGHSVMDKVNAFNDDQEKIVRLMLNLSGQLARAENAVQALDPNADSKAKKLASDKLRHQRSKYEEAKSIKDDMDKRKEQVTSLVQEHLEENECRLFALFILKKPQLTIELQELEDKIKLGREQMDELKKSIPENKNTS